LISVFDPLAVILLLASQVSFDNLRTRNKEEQTPNPYVADVGEKPTAEELTSFYEPDDGPLTDDQIEQIKETVDIAPPPEEDHHEIDHRSLIIDHWVKLAKSKRVKMADIPLEYLEEVKPRV
jgi:hypothetical protein